MVEAFNFVDSGRTYTCRVEEPRASRAEAWWWFDVSGDRQRYAPFPAVAGDTRDSVQSRVVAYYENRLARRAQPATPYSWMGRGQAKKAESA